MGDTKYMYVNSNLAGIAKNHGIDHNGGATPSVYKLLP